MAGIGGNRRLRSSGPSLHCWRPQRWLSSAPVPDHLGRAGLAPNAEKMSHVIPTHPATTPPQSPIEGGQGAPPYFGERDSAAPRGRGSPSDNAKPHTSERSNRKTRTAAKRGVAACTRRARTTAERCLLRCANPIANSPRAANACANAGWRRLKARGRARSASTPSSNEAPGRTRRHCGAPTVF